MTRTPKLFLLVAALAVVFAPDAQAQIIFNGGDIEAAASFTPTGVPGLGDVVSFGNVAGTTSSNLDTLDGTTFNQTAGTLTGVLNVNSDLTYNLSGGTLNGLGGGGANFNANGSVFNLTGGLLQFGGALIVNTTNGVINLGGDANIEAVTDDFDLFINNDEGQFNIAADWTGSLISNNDVTAADWIAELITGGSRLGDGGPVDLDRLINVGGTEITAGNFGDFFEIAVNADGTGSALSLIADSVAIPEPSSVTLLGLFALGLGTYRRR